MKVQMSSGVTALPARLPLGGVARGAAGGELLEGDRVLARAGHPDHVLEQRQPRRGPRGSSPAARRPRRRRPWRRSSRARTGTPRASWSGRSGRRSRRPRAPRSRSRSTRGGCCRGSRPCRPWRRRGRSGPARASRTVSPTSLEAAVDPLLALLEAHRRRACRTSPPTAAAGPRACSIWFPAPIAGEV